jgi:hypothetical protein
MACCRACLKGLQGKGMEATISVALRSDLFYVDFTAP